MAVQGKLSAIELATAVARPLIIRALGNTEEKALPHGVLEALAADESEYCDAFEGDFKKGCAETFQANLMWVQLQVAPQGIPGILVQNNNTGFCGVAVVEGGIELFGTEKRITTRLSFPCTVPLVRGGLVTLFQAAVSAETGVGIGVGKGQQREHAQVLGRLDQPGKMADDGGILQVAPL